tara:strand:+ start:394 stop:522 length:129 start_codon:yes stop_codon:yes gene_type:complete
MKFFQDWNEDYEDDGEWGEGEPPCKNKDNDSEQQSPVKDKAI